MATQTKRTKRKRSYKNMLIGPVLIAVTLVMLVINLVLPDKSFSDAENRVLKSFPGLQMAGLYEGTAQAELDTWYDDQFTGRQTDFHISYLIRKLAGQREINNVFLGRGALLGQSETPSEEIISGNTAAINTFAEKSELPVTVLIAPNAATIQASKLPWFAPVLSQNDMLDSIYGQLEPMVAEADIRDTFKKNQSEYLYYKTDHHWTTLGAGLAWQVFTGANGTPASLDQYNRMQVSSSFTGTLAGKTGSVFLEDDIYIAVANDNPEYIVTWADGSKTTSIYNRAALEERDQYQVFLGSNQSVVHIDTTIDNKKHLLVLKDSYANSLIQYMLPYYQSITIVDPRYYYEDLHTLLDLYNINEAAVIFSCDTYVTDPSIQAVLKTAIEEETEDEDSDTTITTIE